MSLKFNLADVIKRKGEAYVTDPWDEKKWHPVTQAIVWRLMVIDVGEIEEKNVDEVWFRVNLWQLVTGNYAVAWNDPPTTGYLTREDIEGHVGLSTNVGTKTRRQWLDRMFGKAVADKFHVGHQEKSAHQMVADRHEEMKK